MIDNASILISTLVVLYIIWRAARMDRAQPWFETRAMYEKAQGRDGGAIQKKPALSRLFRR
jgi:hypothetical protein